MAEERNSGVQPALPAVPCLATVVSHLDTTFMGGLEVRILRPGAGNDTGSGQTQTVRYMSPFWGNTGVEFLGRENDYNNTQKSYGMWMVPPDVGSTVLVVFVNGDPSRGYWIGCVPDENMNFMVPGYASTQYTVEKADPDVSKRSGRVPVAEYNKLESTGNSDTTKFKKPIHPIAEVLKKQGLILDDIRGITTSSARRETPSMVFGISTPGPFDKRPNSKTGAIGKNESVVKNAPVSHLGGSSFVMDDGDDKFLRKKHAGEAPPEYVSVEAGETGGNVTIPHNELIRIRTRTGHQILLHNSEDLIYIGNARGTTWIELTSNGKIDIYAEDSISIRTTQDLNVTADRDINFKAGRNINFNATNNVKITAGANFEVKAAADGKITYGGTSNIRAGGDHKVTAANIHMNGPAAATASAAPIPGRVPGAEPWAGHENLDPQRFVPAKTEAAVPDPNAKTGEPPSMYKNYTTKTDTFSKGTG